MGNLLLDVTFYGNTLVKRYLAAFLCTLHLVWVRDVSGTYQFWVTMYRPTLRNLVLCWTWFVLNRESALINVRSADICPIHNRYKTGKPCMAQLRLYTLPNYTRPIQHHTNIRPTDNSLLRRDLWIMFARSLPNKFVCLNINPSQTDQTDLSQNLMNFVGLPSSTHFYEISKLRNFLFRKFIWNIISKIDFI